MHQVLIINTTNTWHTYPYLYSTVMMMIIILNTYTHTPPDHASENFYSSLDFYWATDPTTWQNIPILKNNNKTKMKHILHFIVWQYKSVNCMDGTTYFLWVQKGDNNNIKIKEPNWKEHVIKNTWWSMSESKCYRWISKRKLFSKGQEEGN